MCGCGCEDEDRGEGGGGALGPQQVRHTHATLSRFSYPVPPLPVCPRSLHSENEMYAVFTSDEDPHLMDWDSKHVLQLSDDRALTLYRVGLHDGEYRFTHSTYTDPPQMETVDVYTSEQRGGNRVKRRKIENPPVHVFILSLDNQEPNIIDSFLVPRVDSRQRNVSRNFFELNFFELIALIHT